jgi:hypothetical protein
MQDLSSSLLLLLSLASFGLPNPASPPSPYLAPNSQTPQLSTSESSLKSSERSQSLLDIFRAFQQSFLPSQRRAQAFQHNSTSYNSTSSQNKSKIFLAKNSSTTSDFSPADLSDLTSSSSEVQKPASGNDTSEHSESFFSSFSAVEEKSTAKTTSIEKLSRHLASPDFLRSNSANSGDESSSQETTSREQSRTVSEDKTKQDDSSNLQEFMQDDVYEN